MLARPGSHRERMERHRYPAPKPQRSVWTGIGIALVTVLCAGGLLILAGMVLSFMTLSATASNK